MHSVREEKKKKKTIFILLFTLFLLDITNEHRVFFYRSPTIVTPTDRRHHTFMYPRFI
jgi:hypothetical protein